MLGITVYKAVMSMVKLILFSLKKLKLRNILSAWLLSLIYEGSDLTMAVMTLAKQLEINREKTQPQPMEKHHSRNQLVQIYRKQTTFQLHLFQHRRVLATHLSAKTS